MLYQPYYLTQTCILPKQALGGIPHFKMKLLNFHNHSPSSLLLPLPTHTLSPSLRLNSHSCYLLQVLYQYLPKSELLDLTTMLTDIVQEAHDKAKVNPMFAASMKGRLTSPLPLVNFPLVLSFLPKPLVNHLNPYKMKGFTSPVVTERENKMAVTGPFIYTPIGRKKKDDRPEVVWVEEEPGEIAVEIVNPLPYDLKVEKMVSVTNNKNILCDLSFSQSSKLASLPLAYTTTLCLAICAYTGGYMMGKQIPSLHQLSNMAMCAYTVCT